MQNRCGFWRRSPLQSMRATWFGCALGCAVAACSSTEPGDAPGAGGTGGSSAAGGSSAGAGAGGSLPGTGPCNAVLLASEPTSAVHLEQCLEIEYSTNPPSGGDHYGDWAAFQTYSFPVPHGNLVHSLEHGAVVFWYNCPEGCDGEVAEVEAFIGARPADVSCAGRGAERRAILTPSPTLGSRWAASAWGFALTADCFDAAAFEDFYADHYGRAPEDLCAPGVAFTADPCQ